MLLEEKIALTEKIENYVEQFGRNNSALLLVLQSTQREYSYISDFAQQEAARTLDIHPVEVYSFNNK